jgi:ethanolaminephosphotransferase
MLSNPMYIFFQSMVSGAIGGFLDVALNFNTQAFLDDNLLG